MPIASHRGIHQNIIQSGVVITTITTMTHSIFVFPSLRTKKRSGCLLGAEGGGQPELIWISARRRIKMAYFADGSGGESVLF
jgi:hypothetical protein